MKAGMSKFSSPVGMEDFPDVMAREKVKILLVDDNADNLVSLEAALEILDEQMVVAHSGREALRQLLEHDFAAILLDVKMPDMDGFETAELIRARKRSQHTPILFLTGYRNEEHLFRGYDLGAVDFLFKPIVPEVLRSKVAVFVELHRSVQRQKAQAQILAKAELKFRSLLEAAPDAMLITKESGEIVLANSRADLLFGYKRQELLTGSISRLIPEWNHALGGDVRPFEAVCKNGMRFPAEISSSPLQTEDGLLVTSFIRDITERKRAEQRIAERNQQLADLNRELEAFSYSVSHDLRSPLRSIEGFAKILLRDYSGKMLDSTGDDYLQRMRTAAGRMGQLIEDLLELSRVSRTEFSLKPVNLTDMANDIFQELKTRNPDRQIEISVQPGMTAEADPRLLGVVLSNLLGNAWKFTEKTAHPRIECCRQIKNGQEVFSVRDNGAGFDPAFADKLFSPFQRLHKSSDFEGTGVGLAIVQRVIQRHNGRVWSESEIDKGATFHFTLKGSSDAHGNFPSGSPVGG